jgi:cell division transport system permease protein
VNALQYSLDEALASLWRGRQSGLLSTATIALALFVLGAFLLVTTNLDRLGAEWSRSAELSVYLTDDVSLDQRRAIEGALAPGDLIASREYVSKSDALSRFKQTFGDLASTIDGLGDNPLPASIEVRLRPDAGASASVDALSARLRGMPGVADVRYDRQWLNRLLAAVGVIRGVGVALAAILTLAAALTVANVVRLGLYTRRDELEIMQLVGAPQVYIRGPFVMEGVLQGGLGALVALILLGVVFFDAPGVGAQPLVAPVPARRPLFAGRSGGDGGRVRGRSGRGSTYGILTAVLLRRYTRSSTKTIHLRGPACHASSPIRGRSARSTLSQSSTGKNLSNITAVSSSSAPITQRARLPMSRPRSRRSWVSSNTFPPKTTPRKSSAHSSENSTS